MNSSFADGVVLLVYLAQPNEAFSGGIPVKNPQITEIHGRSFLTGIVPEGYDWSGGKKIGIKFNQIAHFIEFETEQIFIETISTMGNMDNIGTA